MSKIKKAIRYMFKNKYFTIAILVLLALVGYLIFKNNNQQIETITIKYGDFTNQVSVSGTVVPSENVDLGFYLGGRISMVKKQVGYQVAAGEVLASIENEDLRAALEQRQANLLSEQAKLKSLQIGTRPEQIAVTESSVVSAQTALDQATSILLNAISDTYTKSEDAIENKVDQFFSNPLTNTASIVISAPDSNLIASVNADRVSVGTTLSNWEKMISTLNSSVSLDSSITSTQNNLNQIKSFLAEVSSITNNTTSTYQGSSIPSSWKSDVSTARTNIDTTIASFSSTVASFRNAQASLATAKSTLALEKAPATEQDIQAEEALVQAADAAVVNAKATLNKTLITAPFSGEITKMNAKIGEIAAPNVPLISMMSAGMFQIESYVPEVNIAKIVVGQDATITLDAYDDTAIFKAKVISIDPAETVRNGVSTYKTKLQFTDKDDRIKSGMTANVSVTVFDKPNVLTVPESVIYEKNGKKYVQIKREKGAYETEVMTGDKSSLGQVEIMSGLSDGDLVIIKPSVN